MKKKVMVLGNGLVGSVMALDLAADDGYEVTVCDANKIKALRYFEWVSRLGISNPAISR